MTAIDTFFSAVAHENLPAAVPVASEDGEGGIWTTTFNVQSNADACYYASNDDWRKRATAALYACAASREAVDASKELHTL